jgi:hypothetical protein
MARLFDIQIISGTAPGPYTVYYDTVGSGNIATLTSSGLPATSVSFSSLSTGINVTIPDASVTIILYNEQCSSDETFNIPTPTPTPTPTSTPTPTPTSTPTPTPTPTDTPTPTPTPTPNCEFDVVVDNITTPTPTPTPTSTPTPTPTSTPTDTPTPTPTDTPTPTPTPTPTSTPTPTPTPNCGFEFDINVNFAPTDINLSYDRINENSAIGTIVGYLSTATIDSSDTHIYSVVNSAPFTISSNTLVSSISFNYEVTTSYTVAIRTTDTVGQYYDKQFTIYVDNVNEAPYGINISGSIPENSPTGTTAGTLSTLDSDTGDTFTYNFINGSYPDNYSFDLSSSGVLTSLAVFDYETKNAYQLNVRTTDVVTGLYYDGLVSVSVTNVNEPPTGIDLSSSSISENVPTGTTIGTLSTYDPDAGDTFTYTLIDPLQYPDNVNFTITGAVLKSKSVFNYETKDTYLIGVRSTDALGSYAEELIYIYITDSTITVTASATTNVTCNGGSNGVITISNATGGTAAYTYSKDGTNYQAGTTFSSLTAGSYTIYAKDSYGEVGSTSVTVTQPTIISFTSTGTNPTCNSSSDGSITLSSVSGGVAPYTYSIDGTNYQAGTTFSSLPNGTYTTYTKDSSGCVRTNTTGLNRTQVSATTSQYNVLCYGGTGSITVSGGSGGSGSGYQAKNGSGGTYANLPLTYHSLTAGTYTIYVKDSSDCERTYSITITQPSVLIPQGGNNVPPTCYDSSDGIVAFSGGGGTSPYTYSIDGTNYQSSGTFTDLPIGSYTGYVKDANGCVETITRNINRTAPNASFSVTNITCNQSSNGSIVVSSGSGGSGGTYQAKFGSGGTYANLPVTYSSLSAGTYTIYIKDSVGCVQTYNQTITQPTAIGISLDSATPPTCYNGSNGSIVVSGSGGTSPYTYSKDGTNYQSSGTFSSLPVGSYTLYVKDTNGCVTSTSSTLSRSAPYATISASNPSCVGTGTITVTDGGGGSGSGYQAKNGSGGTYADLPVTYSSLGGGAYVIYIKDSSGCEATYSRTITIPSAVTVSLSSSSAPTCYDGSNGSIVVSAGGGNGSYEFRINGGTWQSSGTFSSLGSATYSLQSRDSNDCQSSALNVNITKSAPTASVSQGNVSCNGGSNGSITVSSPSGGSGSGYTYSKDGTNYQAGVTFSSLSIGSYTIYVKDSAGCVNAVTTVTITQPTDQTATITVNTFATCNGGADGEITLSSSGGTFPKTYRLYADTSAPYVTCGGTLVGTYTNKTSGSPSETVGSIDEYGYCVEVTDANGCVTSSGVVSTTACSGTCYSIYIPTANLTNNGESLYIEYRKTNNVYVTQPYSNFPQDIGPGGGVLINVCSIIPISFRYGTGGYQFIPDIEILVGAGGKCDNSEWCGGMDPYIAPPPTATPGTGTYWCKDSEYGVCQEQASPCSGTQINCDPNELQPT